MLGGLEPYQSHISGAIWGTTQAHARFLWRVIPLLLITTFTGGNDILPGLLSATTFGDDMIHGQLGGAEMAAAILTGVLIPGINQTSRQGQGEIAGQFDVATKPNDQGPRQLGRCGANDLIGGLDNFSFLFKQ